MYKPVVEWFSTANDSKILHLLQILLLKKLNWSYFCLVFDPQTVFAKGAHYAVKELSQTDYDVLSLDWTMSAKDAR